DFEQVSAHASELANVADAARRRVAELERALADAERVAQAAVAEASRVTAAAAPGSGTNSANVEELERENALLRARLEEAAERTRQIAESVRYLRQQKGNDGDKSVYSGMWFVYESLVRSTRSEPKPAWLTRAPWPSTSIESRAPFWIAGQWLRPTRLPYW